MYVCVQARENLGGEDAVERETGEDVREDVGEEGATGLAERERRGRPWGCRRGGRGGLFASRGLVEAAGLLLLLLLLLLKVVKLWLEVVLLLLEVLLLGVPCGR